MDTPDQGQGAAEQGKKGHSNVTTCILVARGGGGGESHRPSVSRSQTQNNTYCVIPSTEVQERRTHLSAGGEDRSYLLCVKGRHGLHLDVGGSHR